MQTTTVYLLVFVLVISVVAVILVVPPLLRSPNQPLIDSCVEACRNYVITGRSLDVGPCLMNPIPKTDWVCDVVHNPRNPIDNIPDNQCSAFNDGTATHYIEVDTNCTLVRIF